MFTQYTNGDPIKRLQLSLSPVLSISNKIFRSQKSSDSLSIYRFPTLKHRGCLICVEDNLILCSKYFLWNYMVQKYHGNYVIRMKWWQSSSDLVASDDLNIALWSNCVCLSFLLFPYSLWILKVMEGSSGYYSLRVIISCILFFCTIVSLTRTTLLYLELFPNKINCISFNLSDQT